MSTVKVSGSSSYNGIWFMSDNFSVFVGNTRERVKINSKYVLIRRLRSEWPFVLLLSGSLICDLVIDSNAEISEGFLIFCIFVYTFYAFIAITRGSAIRRFHAAEHMAINAYNSGDVEQIYTASRVADRCGTNFVVNFFIFYIILFIVLSTTQLIVPHFAASLISLILSSSLFSRKWNPLYYLGWLVQKYITTDTPNSTEVEIAKRGIMLLMQCETQRTW